MQRGEFAAALSALEAAERWPPRRAETAYLLARAYRRSGELEQCQTWLETAAGRGWNPEDLQSQGHLLQIQGGRFDEAQSWLARVLSSDVEDELAEEVYEAQAKGFLRSYRLNDAVVCLRFWIQWKPQAIEPRLWLADVWERCDRWQSAADEFQAVVDLAPDHFEAHRRLAENLLNLNRVESACEHFQYCARNAPQDDRVALGMARCLRRLGHLEEAERALVQQLDLYRTESRPVNLLVELGQVSLDLRQTGRAIDLLQEATRADPGHALAHSTLAEVFRRTGQVQLADEHRATADQISQRYDRLTKIIGQLADDPGDADLRYEAGRLMMEQGLRSDGAAWMATALVADPGHRPTHEALEEYFTSIGDTKRASHHRKMRDEPR